MALVDLEPPINIKDLILEEPEVKPKPIFDPYQEIIIPLGGMDKVLAEFKPHQDAEERYSYRQLLDLMGFKVLFPEVEQPQLSPEDSQSIQTKFIAKLELDMQKGKPYSLELFNDAIIHAVLFQSSPNRVNYPQRVADKIKADLDFILYHPDYQTRNELYYLAASLRLLFPKTTFSSVDQERIAQAAKSYADGMAQEYLNNDYVAGIQMLYLNVLVINKILSGEVKANQSPEIEKWFSQLQTQQRENDPETWKKHILQAAGYLKLFADPNIKFTPSGIDFGQPNQTLAEAESLPKVRQF